jgi:two-component system, OmpR family, sensor histidine kinase KdpD
MAVVMKRSVVGTVAGLSSAVLLTSAMVPVRGHLSVATPALILVVPVVIGVVCGGFVAGALSVAAGFLVYDFFFIPPYLTLKVGTVESWVALAVYAVVMLLVARVVAVMNVARARAQRQGGEIRELFELSDLLVADKPLDVLLSVIASTLADVFEARQVALLLPADDQLTIVASAGEPLSREQLRRVLPAPGELATLGPRPLERDGLVVLALATAGRPIGLLVLSAETVARHEREPLLIFANQIALAVERAQLREQVLRTRLTEEVTRLAKTLVAAVSHDLRAPLASIKASSSTLADADLAIGPEASRRLAQLIDVQADRLADLVQNLLDMSRIQAGVLQPRYSVASLADLVDVVLRDLTPALRGHAVRVEIPCDLPPVDVDLVLMSRVLTNFLENAIRHSPKNAPITLRATLRGPDRIEVSVTDRGPGVSADRRHQIFELFARRPGDAGAGLGLTIAKAFVEAHGQRIWVDDGPDGGARFCFTVPIAASIPEESNLAADSHH